MKQNRIIIGVIAAVILAVIVYFAWPRLTASAASTASLQTATVQRGTLVATVSAAGNVSAPEEANLSFLTSGRVTAVNVQVGDSVKAGQVLMQLDTTDLQLALQSAQAGLQSVQANYDQAKLTDAQSVNQLIVAKAQVDQAAVALQQAQSAYDAIAWRGNVSSSPQAVALAQANANYQSAIANYKITAAGINHTALQQAQAQLQAAQVAVQQAQQNINEAKIVAPFDGTVAAVNYSVGDMAATGAAVTLANLFNLQVQATLSEIDVVNVKVGQTAQLTLDALPNKTYNAQVTEIGPSGTVTQGVVNYPVTLKITNNDGSIKPGMTANLNIAVAEHQDVLYVPTRAVHTQGTQHVVTVLYKGQEFSVPVQTGLSSDQDIEIDQGLKQGDVVVLNTTQTTQPTFRGGGFGFGG